MTFTQLKWNASRARHLSSRLHVNCFLTPRLRLRTRQFSESSFSKEAADFIKSALVDPVDEESGDFLLTCQILKGALVVLGVR